MATGIFAGLFGKRPTQMTSGEAQMLYSGDPDIVVAAGADVVPWLAQQGPDVWHAVATTWNYGYGVEGLRWILSQDQCDKGTSTHVFLVEGMGHWLWDVRQKQETFENKSHLCRIVLDNWSTYRSGDLRPTITAHANQLDTARKLADAPPFDTTPLAEILRYEGSRDAVSAYDSMDGQIVQSFDGWLAHKNIELTS
ncbi:DUF4274 domain-containing protein [Pseudooctadecabacter sp.]|uniref:DUF4274 domain-containing protein n=1 Tax=Pseudooctadecabacter sp. TaxID=1966338 RepID=UPI0035C86E76